MSRPVYRTPAGNELSPMTDAERERFKKLVAEARERGIKSPGVWVCQNVAPWNGKG